MCLQTSINLGASGSDAELFKILAKELVSASVYPALKKLGASHDAGCGSIAVVSLISSRPISANSIQAILLSLIALAVRSVLEGNSATFYAVAHHMVRLALVVHISR